jgi:hypothetical protein
MRLNGKTPAPTAQKRQVSLVIVENFGVHFYQRSDIVEINAFLSLFQKLQAWFQLPNGEWQLGKIIKSSGADTVLSLPNGQVCFFFIR